MQKLISSLVSFVFVSCYSGLVEAQVVNNVNAEEFSKLIYSDEGIILDIRTIDEVNKGHIEDATNIDFYASDFTSKLDLIRKDVSVYVYCASGGRSSKTVAKMRDLGFKKVFNLIGGFSAWKLANFKFIKTKEQVFKKQKSISIIEFSDIIEGNDVVLVDFSTQWCIPCKKMKPVIEEIKKENKALKGVFIDVDANKEVVRKYKLRGVPVFIVFKDGNEEFRHVGMIDKKELLNKIKLE